ALTRGLNVQLLRVVNGSSTVLSQLNSTSWFSDRWAQATLQVSGTTVQAQVMRPDTGQYLGSNGQWQAAPAWALIATDAAITQPGFVGLARPGSYTGAVTFDNFSVTPLTAAPPPPAAQGVSEAFDTTAVGAVPAGWTQYSSTGAPAFAVASGQALSAANALAVTASSSGTSARAWLQAAQAADVQVSAAVHLNSLIPAQVLARGSGLGGTVPTYYALSLTRGLNVQLLRVVKPTSTVIAQLNSASWFSDRWARVTLYVNGNNLRAQVYRPDTAQFLNSTGQWQSAQAWALNLTDAAITQSGNVGLGRPAS